MFADIINFVYIVNVVMLQVVISRANDLLREMEAMLSSEEFGCVKGLAELSSGLGSKVEAVTMELDRVGTGIENTALCYRLVDEVKK